MIALLATRIGRWVVGAAAGVLALLAVLGTARRAGRQAERQKQTEAALENLRSREKTDEDVAHRGADDRRRDLGRWVR